MHVLHNKLRTKSKCGVKVKAAGTLHVCNCQRSLHVLHNKLRTKSECGVKV